LGHYASTAKGVVQNVENKGKKKKKFFMVTATKTLIFDTYYTEA